jgi:type I restriction enzyme R subunit
MSRSKPNVRLRPQKFVDLSRTQRDSVQAEIRLKVKKILRKYGYTSDKQEKATQTVLDQAELIARDWVAA